MRPLERAGMWLRRARRLFRIGTIERAMDAEMRHHLACEAAERERGGASPKDARLAALRDFGGVERFKEEARDARGLRPIEDAAADVRYALRLLRNTPVQTAAIVLTFALAVAAAGAIFAFAYGVLLRPLPYANPDRLVAIWERNIPLNRDRNVASVENVQAWRSASTSFAGLAALVPRPATLTRDGTPERVMGAEVSPGYFSLLGVAPAIGRDFDAADAHAGSTVVILSHAFWAERFGSDPDVVGRSLALADTTATIVGVMPQGFEPPRFGWLDVQDLWFPFAATPENRRWGRFLQVIARVRPDVRIDAARAELTAIADRLASDNPVNKGWNVSVVPLAEQITGDVRAPLGMLLLAVTLLFLIAVANVATLMAAAIRRRTPELAIRRSFGATDRRLFRQLFTQHTLVGAIGGATGLALVPAGVGLLVALAPPSLPRLTSVRVDAPVVEIACAIVGIAILVFGVSASAPRLHLSLREAAETGTRTSERGAGRSVLMVLEIAAALALGIVATLMVRSFAGLRSVDLGFDADNVVAVRVSTSGRVADGAPARAFFDDLADRIRRQPGVQSVGVISTRPFFSPGVTTRVADPRAPQAASSLDIAADVRVVNSALFETLRIPLLSGTTFDDAESGNGALTVVVNRRLAHEVFATDAAVGREVFLDLYNGITCRIVGIVGDVHLADARTPARATAYLSAARFPSDTRDVVVRVSGDPLAIVPKLRAAVAAGAPGVPLSAIESMTRTVDSAIAPERATMFVLSACAGIALLMGAVGIVGVVAGEAGRRRKEIGLRMALGAGAPAVVWLLLRETLARASAGIAAGLIVAALFARSMTALLYGVAPFDPASYVGAAAGVLALALIATLVPVALALRASPIAALREN